MQCSESDHSDCNYDDLMMLIIIVTIVSIGIAEEWSGNLNLFAHKADCNGFGFFLVFFVKQVCIPCGSSLHGR